MKAKQPPIVKALSGGEAHSYSVELKADQFIHLVVEQDGIDIVISLHSPDASQLRRVNSPNGEKGTETFNWVAELKGTYRLEIASLKTTAKPGSYALKDVEIRSATARDRKYVAAEMAFAEAETLRATAGNKPSREALAKYESALPLWRDVGERQREATTLFRIGRTHLLLKEPLKAIDPLDQSLPLFRTLGDRDGEVLSLINLGLVWAELKQDYAAEEFYLKALDLCRAGKQCETEADILINLATVQRGSNNTKEALESYKQAATLLAKTGRRNQMALTLDWIGVSYSQMDKWPEAVETYNQLLTLRQDMKDRKGEGMALRRLGGVYSDMGEQRKGIEFYERALSIAQADADQYALLGIRFWMGTAYQALDEQTKAIELFTQALATATGDDRVNILSALARSHRLSDNRQLALETYKQAFSLIPAPTPGMEKFRNRSEAELRIADIEKEMRDQENLKALEAEAGARRAAGDSANELSALKAIGDIQVKLREGQAALETFNRAVSLAQTLGDKQGQAELLNKMGLIHLALQDKQKAHGNLKQSLELFRQIGDRRDGQTMMATVNLVNSMLRRIPGRPEDEFEVQAIQAYFSVGDNRLVRASVANGQLQLWIANRHLDALLIQNHLLKEAMAERVSTASVEGKLRTILSRFDSHVKAERWQDALKKGNELLDLRRGSKFQGTSIFYASTLHKLGHVYSSINDHRRALDLYTQALAMWRELKNSKGEAELKNRNGEAATLVAIGFTYNWLGNRAEALKSYEEALNLQRLPGNEEGQALTLYRIGEVQFLMGEKQKALEFLNKAWAKRPATQEDEFGSRITEYIARVYASLGQQQKEQESYKRALEQSKRFLAIVREVRSLALGKALAESPRDKEDFLQWHNSRQGTALADMGEAYYRLGMKSEGLATFNEALPILKDAGKRAREADALLKLGLLYLSNGDRTKALAELDQVLTLRRADGNRGGQAEVLHTIGTLYDSSGDKQKAIEYYSQALTLRREVKDPEGEGETLDKLMLLWKSLDKSQLAIFYGKQAVNAFQRIRSNITGLDKELQKGFLTSRADTYRQLADLLISNGRLPEAQQVLDILKHEEYLDFVRSDPASDPNSGATLTRNEAALLQRYAEVESQIIAFARKSSELRSKESLTPEEKKLLDKLEKDLEAANVAFDKFLSQLPLQFKDAAQGTAKALELRSAQALSETLRELGAGVVVLYTVATAEKYHVILITPETQVARQYSIKIADLNRKVQQFRTALQNPKYDPLPLAQELYRILVGPVAKDLEAAKAETVMWSLDGTLRYLPMAALHDGKQYMVEKYRNTVFTPASQSRLERPPSARWRGLGLGVSKSAVPLPFVIDELHGIIRDETDKTPTEGVLAGKIMLDDTFTKVGMKDALRQDKGFSLVHIASHFVFKPGNETDSYLLLGGSATDKEEDKQFTLAEIKRAPNLFRGVELLTLSACNTGVGSGAGGAGAEVENFGVLAQLKGARAVIATLWRVNDKSTMRLMRTFYQLHNDQPSAPKVEALRQAQLALLRGQIMTTAGEPARGGDAATPDQLDAGLLPFKADPRAPYAHPYYWAPFILIGNWR